ncbi:MAG: tetratricopeptide repeat protein, partial [Actinomycetota bacterium]|nr:tetratricopeptide repeat protein [Actinomycetota bacterium]
LWERSGGWPTVVVHALEMMREVEPDHRAEILEQLTRPGERLHSYLAEEVIGTEPEPVREVLRRLAVLEGANVSSVLTSGAVNDACILADLTRRGLVQCTLGHLDRWSLVRPLRDYFDHEPPLPAPDAVRLHRIAAEECTCRRAYADALGHLLAAGDHAGCAALLVEHGVTMVNSGRVGVVLDAAGLPPEHLADPQIQRVLGQARQVRGYWAGARECFERARNGAGELDPALAWRASLIAYRKGDLDEVLALSERIGRGDAADEARLSALLACASRMVGDYAGCRTQAAQAVETARQCGDSGARAAGLAALALLAAADGDRLRAEAHFADALDAAEVGEDLLQVLRIRVWRALHHVEMGRPRDGLAEAEIALGLAESCGDPSLTASALTIRGSANNRLGVLEAALADFAAARDLFQRLGSRFLAWPLCGLGDVHRTLGHPARARAAYEEALTLAEPCHEVLGVSAALIGLARIRAVDDLPAARTLAERAVALGEPLRQVRALLTRGWVALLAEERQAAAADASRAAAVARLRRDDPGLAEALVLEVLSSDDPTRNGTLLTEAIQIWAETGCRIEEAAGRVVAGRIGTAPAEADVAERTLRAAGLELKARRVAGPLAVVARSMPTVSIRSLGMFQVLHEGVPIPSNAWQSRKARDLVKILVTRRRPVTRDQLMELLWPDVEPTKSGNRLSVLLSTVRDVLTPPHDTTATPLITEGNTVWLDRTRVSIDVEEFLTHAHAALTAHRRGQPDATDRLLAAEAEHTGDFLEEDPYQEWAEALADEVRATHIALLRALVSRLRETGDVEGTVRYSLRLLEQDRYDEEAHLDLIQIHVDSGHHGEALRRYRIYVRRMTELGIEARPFPHT